MAGRGQRSSLAETTYFSQSKRAEDDFRRGERATAWAKEGQLSTASTDLLGEPAAHSKTVTKEMRDRHPAPWAKDVASGPHAPPSDPNLATLPTITLVQEALLSFCIRTLQRDRSRRRPQHIKGGLIPGALVRAGASPPGAGAGSWPGEGTHPPAPNSPATRSQP